MRASGLTPPPSLSATRWCTAPGSLRQAASTPTSVAARCGVLTACCPRSGASAKGEGPAGATGLVLREGVVTEVWLGESALAQQMPEDWVSHLQLTQDQIGDAVPLGLGAIAPTSAQVTCVLSQSTGHLWTYESLAGGNKRRLFAMDAYLTRETASRPPVAPCTTCLHHVCMVS
jgi:hypothetical protein